MSSYTASENVQRVYDHHVLPHVAVYDRFLSWLINLGRSVTEATFEHIERVQSHDLHVTIEGVEMRSSLSGIPEFRQLDFRQYELSPMAKFHCTFAN